MGGYPSKEAEIVKAENFHRQSLDDKSFSFLNVQRLGDWRRPAASHPQLQPWQVQGSRQEVQGSGHHKSGDTQAVLPRLKPGDTAWP